MPWGVGGGRGSAKRGGTLTVVQGVDISHHDVQSAPGYESVWIRMNIHNSLLNLDKDLNVVPDLAKKWEVVTR